MVSGDSSKILVLGSNSFAGSSFVNYSLSKGAQVLGFSRSDEPHPIMLPYKKNEQLGQFEFSKLDINNDFHKLIDRIHEFQPDYFVDFAGQGMVAQSWVKPEQWFQTNLLSKVKLHEELRQMRFLKKYVRTSTPEVYGSTDQPATEAHRFNPSTPYAVSHAAIDMSLMSFYKNYDFPVVFTRSANFYGPHQQLYRIIPRTIIYGLIGKKLMLHGGGHSVRSFVHPRDFCSAMWEAMVAGVPGEAYHIASDEVLSIRDLVARICSLMGLEFQDLAEVGEDRPGKDQAYLLNLEKTKKQLGWTSHVSLDEGLAETITWVKKNIDQIKDMPLEYIHKA